MADVEQHAESIISQTSCYRCTDEIMQRKAVSRHLYGVRDGKVKYEWEVHVGTKVPEV